MVLEDTIRHAVCTLTHELHKAAVAPQDYSANIEWKKKDDPVTPFDKDTERDFRRAVSEYDVAVTGEEFGADVEAALGRIYIDPIDSTKSFVRGKHGSALSVGLVQAGKFTLGAVGDLQAGVVYYADKDYGARYDVLTGRISALTQRSPLSKPLLAANDAALSLLAQARANGFGVMTAAGVALPLAMVAAGTYDAYVLQPEQGRDGPNAHDVAGGIALCTYAGVPVTDLDGGEIDWRTLHNGHLNNGIVAAWPEVLPRLQKLFDERRLNQQRAEHGVYS